jgi:transcriptional regulator with XRE-family HTH domain
MSTQLNTTQRKIIALARLQRGNRTRKELFADEDRISFNTYANFESGNAWPRAANLRIIEDLLGWKQGVIDEALASDMPAGDLTLAHMHGSMSFDGGRMSISDFSDAEYFADLPRRIQRIEELLARLEQYAPDLNNGAPA